MGAGKSLLIAEIVASCICTGDERVVITTPSVDLVDQLWETLVVRLGTERVGRFYTHAKETKKEVIVCCDDSAVKLARQLDRVALLIADEAHKTECDSFAKALEEMSPSAALGFTATPFRSSRKDSLRLFEKAEGRHAPLLYRYGPKEGLRDRVVVPWRIVPWAGKEVELDTACTEICEKAEGPGVVSASNVDDAEEFAAWLTHRGTPAVALHYRSGRQAKKLALQQLRDGEIKVVVAVNMLTEGVDLPWLRWLCLRRQMSSRVAFAQFVGRALRSHPGKGHATLYDPWNLFDTHRISHEAALQGGVEEAEEVTEASDPAEQAARAAKARYATALAAGPAFLVRTVVALAACQVLPEPKVWSGRNRKSTPNQVSAIERSARLLSTVTMPAEVVAGLRDVYRVRTSLTIGQASDFLNIIYRLPRCGWPPEATTLVGGPDV